MATETNVQEDALCFMAMGPSLLQKLAVGSSWRLAVGGWWRLAVGGWRLAVFLRTALHITHFGCKIYQPRPKCTATCMIPYPPKTCKQTHPKEPLVLLNNACFQPLDTHNKKKSFPALDHIYSILQKKMSQQAPGHRPNTLCHAVIYALLVRLAERQVLSGSDFFSTPIKCCTIHH